MHGRYDKVTPRAKGNIHPPPSTAKRGLRYPMAPAKEHGLKRGYTL